MTTRTYVRSMLIAALIIISIGGELFHIRIHSPAQNLSNILPIIGGILSILAVPLLFCYRKTIAYGYVLNGFLVIIGTVTMAHFAIVHRLYPVTIESIILKSTLGDILILWGKFFIGKSIFDLEMFGYDPNRIKKGITYRYPNLGWWLIHLVAVAIVYSLGNILWR
jgi:hypothetical protein